MQVQSYNQKDLSKYLSMRAASATKANSACAGFGFGMGLGLGPSGNSAPVFNGNFVELFTSPYQVMQADRGLSYGATPKATAGNTATTVITLSGTAPSTLVPVWFKAENTAVVGAGATFAVSFDGGSTYPITGLPPTAGVPVALTGAGTNLSAAWSAGTSVLNNTWKATAAGNLDQSGNGLHYTAASVAREPIIALGADGKIELLFDGSANGYGSGLNIANNTLIWIVARQITWSAYKRYVGDGVTTDKHEILQDGFTATPNVALNHNGGHPNGGALVIGTNARIAGVFNGASSSIKVGANAVVNGSTGAYLTGSGRSIGCVRANGATSDFANVAVRAVVYAPAQSYAAADLQAASYWSALV